MGAAATRPQVIEFLTAARGKNVSVAEIAAATGLTKSQILAVMNRLLVQGTMPISVIVKANVWRYEKDGVTPIQVANGWSPEATERKVAKAKPAAEPTLVGQMFECIGVQSSGRIIVRGEDSKLYALREL